MRPCLAVATGILGVHRGDPGRLRNRPTAAGPDVPDQTTLFALLQSDPWSGSGTHPRSRQQIKAAGYLNPQGPLGLAWGRPTPSPPSLAAPAARLQPRFRCGDGLILSEGKVAGISSFTRSFRRHVDEHSLTAKQQLLDVNFCQSDVLCRCLDGTERSVGIPLPFTGDFEPAGGKIAPVERF